MSAHMEDEHQKQLEALRDYIVKIQAEMFSEGARYNNLIIVAGYVGSFSLWSLVKNYLGPFATNWVGMLLGISLCTFVGWTVFNMLRMQWQRFQWSQKIYGLQPAEFLAKGREHDDAIRRSVLGWYTWAWSAVVFTATLTWFAAFTILIVNCAQNISRL